MKCRSWRLQRDSHLPLHPPGTCRTCWGTCRDDAPPGRRRCAACEHALLHSGSVPVLAALAYEPDVLPETLTALRSMSGDIRVVGPASLRLGLPVFAEEMD